MILFSTIHVLNCVLAGNINSIECGIAAIVIVSVNGARTTNRIVGGEPVNIANYPYQVSVRRRGQHICGGAIIDKNWVLTAAHCVHKNHFGKYSIRSNSSSRSSGGQIHLVGPWGIIVHKKFNFDTADYDIALIRVYGSLLSETSVAETVALPTYNQIFGTGTIANVSGWGYLKFGSGEKPEQLHAVQVPIVDHARCKQLNINYKGFAVTERMICAGYDEGGKNACTFDSGGPLVIKGVLAGIVSWGPGCALPYKPEVYASVANLRQWIAENANI